MSSPISELSQLYGEAFFDRHVPWQQEYGAVADILASSIPFSSSLDLGCGSAGLLARLHDLGKDVCGLDGSSAALAATPQTIRPFVRLQDLRKPIRLGPFDLVICTEVAEHLKPHYADRLIKSICVSSRGRVFFTAAVPGQGGIGHLNEQPLGYWVQKFHAQGYQLDEALTLLLHRKLSAVTRRIWWLARNATIFERMHGGRKDERHARRPEGKTRRFVRREIASRQSPEVLGLAGEGSIG
ncbi:MAG: class I SAM-dependent methyltransferase [Verrucomicrobia bacterium]|nr:class I SAM-dependent methyltransferase [Verrucomicrobiota bacterium]